MYIYIFWIKIDTYVVKFFALFVHLCKYNVCYDVFCKWFVIQYKPRSHLAAASLPPRLHASGCSASEYPAPASPPPSLVTWHLPTKKAIFSFALVLQGRPNVSHTGGWGTVSGEVWPKLSQHARWFCSYKVKLSCKISHVTNWTIQNIHITSTYSSLSEPLQSGEMWD